MPAYNPPEQVLFSPVTNYYQGKAIRASLAAGEQDAQLKDLQISMMRDELENAPNERERAEKMWDMQYKSAEANLEGALLENGEKTMQFMATSLSALTSQATEDAINGDVEGALDRFNSGIQAAKSSFPAPIAEKVKSGAGEDGVYNAEELANLKMTLAPWWARDPSDRSPRSVLVDGQPAEVFWDKAGNMYYEDGRPVLGQVTPFATNEAGVVGTGRTDAQYGKGVDDFLENTIGAASAIVTGTELLDISLSSPEAIGTPGAIMRWGGGLVEGTRSIMDWAGMEFEPDRLQSQGYDSAEEATANQNVGSGAFEYGRRKDENGEWIGWDLEKLGISASEATKFQAGIYGIAFAAAVAEQGTRPTDKDIQQFIDQIGGRSSSPRAFRDTIFQFMKRQNERLHIIAETKGIKGGPDADRAFATWNPRFRAFVLKYAQVSGLEAGRNAETGQVQIIYGNGRKEIF